MAEFKKRGGFVGKKPGGFRNGPARPSFGARAPFRRDTGDVQEKFPATCATCSKPTMVPFRPNGVKPVYCRDCFRGDSDVPAHRDMRSAAPRFAPAPDASTKQLEMINMKLDTLIRMLKDSAR